MKQDPVDLLEIHGSNLIADGLEQGAEAEVARAPQEAFTGSNDEGQGLPREGVVTQTRFVHLSEQELFDDFRRETWEHDGVGDARTDLHTSPEV